MIILANFGIHKERPFLLHCVEENSTLLDTMDNNSLCTNLTSCFSEPSKANLTDLSGALQMLDQANSKFEEEANKSTLVLENMELMREKVREVQLLQEQVKEELQKMERNPKGLIQKVRVCGKNETTIKIVTLSSLVCLLVLAALATYQLHKITDYKVGLVRTIYLQSDTHPTFKSGVLLRFRKCCWMRGKQQAQGYP